MMMGPKGAEELDYRNEKALVSLLGMNLTSHQSQPSQDFFLMIPKFAC